MADRLAAAGVRVKYREYSGQVPAQAPPPPALPTPKATVKLWSFLRRIQETWTRLWLALPWFLGARPVALPTMAGAHLLDVRPRARARGRRLRPTARRRLRRLPAVAGCPRYQQCPSRFPPSTHSPLHPSRFLTSTHSPLHPSRFPTSIHSPLHPSRFLTSIHSPLTPRALLRSLPAQSTAAHRPGAGSPRRRAAPRRPRQIWTTSSLAATT